MTEGDTATFEGQPSWDGNVSLPARFVGDTQRGLVGVTQLPKDAPAEFIDVRLTGARFQNVNLAQARLSETVLRDADIWAWGRNLTGSLEGLRINGVEVGPLIEAELDRQQPERTRLRDIEDAASMRQAWRIIEEMWTPTIERARRLPEASLNERVAGAFSFLETLRHLIFCTDAWVRRTILSDPQPYSPLGVKSLGEQLTWLGIDVTVTPTLDEVLAARQERVECVRSVVEGLTDDSFASMPPRNASFGYPPSEAWRSTADCLRTIVNEHWWHHQYAVRDLAALESNGS